MKYGVVEGVSTQSAAIVSELRSIAKSAGESPLVSKPFRYKGKNTVGVFYVVKDHSAQNAPLIGLILSDFDDRKLVETAVMYDAAPRFPNALETMMETVFKEWRPGGAKSAANTSSGRASAALPPMHEVRLQDGTASARIPDGWQVGAGSHLGTIGILGPHQEFLVLNGNMLAQDPRASGYQNMVRMGIRAPAIQVVAPFDTDWVKAIPNLYVTFAHVLKWNPTALAFDHAEAVPGTGSKRCVQGTGHVDNGSGPMELSAMFCPEPSDQPQTGSYLIFEFISLIPDSYAERERATVAAVFDSYQWDEDAAKRLAAAAAAPVIHTMNRVYQDHMHALTEFTQSQIARTRAIGREVSNRIADQQKANEAHNREWREQEVEVGRYPQGFSDYILDRSVVQYTDYNGDVYHATVPNNIAYGLVEHHSDKFELIETRDYIPGIDFRK